MNLSLLVYLNGLLKWFIQMFYSSTLLKSLFKVTHFFSYILCYFKDEMLTIKSFLRIFLSAACLLASVVAYAAGGFVLNDTTGKAHALSQYQGKWVVVNYWATWCPPCLEEIPDLVALYDTRKNKDVMVIGVAFEYQNAQEIKRYAEDMLISYPIVLGDGAAIKQIGSADVLPTTYIYNPQGMLVKTKRGLVTKQYLESVIASDPVK